MTSRTSPARRRRRKVIVTLAVTAALAGGLAATGVAAADENRHRHRHSWGWGWWHWDRSAGDAQRQDTPRHRAPAEPDTPELPVPPEQPAPEVAPEPQPPARPEPLSPPERPSSGITLPPDNAGFDYQIGGGYDVPKGIGVVSRDRTDEPAAGVYNVCYVNAFQSQPDEASWWQRNHDDLLLKRGGSYVIDSKWDEMIFDISTAAKRSALAEIVGGWIDGCAASGFQAVEADNFDVAGRSEGLLTDANALAFAKLLADRAHRAGLAYGQKNAAELSAQAKRTVGTDFAVAEECARWDECAAYTSVYGTKVLVIEYRSADFERACDDYGDTLSIVLRDEDVRPARERGYVYRAC